LFLEYLRKINELHEKPAFYNTLLDNCTTAIWFNTRVNPGHLPFSWKILLSGYVPEYLYESKALVTRLPFEEYCSGKPILIQRLKLPISRLIFHSAFELLL
jgi:hypothetical protein